MTTNQVYVFLTRYFLLMVPCHTLTTQVSIVSYPYLRRF